MGALTGAGVLGALPQDPVLLALHALLEGTHLVPCAIMRANVMPAGLPPAHRGREGGWEGRKEEKEKRRRFFFCVCACVVSLLFSLSYGSSLTVVCAFLYCSSLFLCVYKTVQYSTAQYRA